MKRAEYIIIALATLTLALCVAGILLTLVGTAGKMYTQYDKRERLHLPTICAPHYNKQNDDWIECMGVGYK